MTQPIRYVCADGTPVQPEPGPMTLEVYYGNERLYAPGWVDHCPGCDTCLYRGQPHIIMTRLEGPCRATL